MRYWYVSSSFNVTAQNNLKRDKFIVIALLIPQESVNCNPAKGHLLTHSLQLLLAIHVFNSVSYFLREQDHPFILYQVELQTKVREDFTITERLKVKLIGT